MTTAHEREPSAPPPAVDADVKLRQMEVLIGNLLRVGVLASLALVVIGTILSFVHHPDYANVRDQLPALIRPGSPFPKTVPEVARDLRELRGRAIVVLGLLLLIATPVLRVAASIIAFAVQGDRLYMLITTIVLALLITSFLLGKAG